MNGSIINSDIGTVPTVAVAIVAVQRGVTRMDGTALRVHLVVPISPWSR